MMRKKRFEFLLSILTLSAALTACSQGSNPAKTNPTESSSDLLAQIQERGEIVIATEGTWAPWTYHDESGNLVGFDVEITQKIAERLGVTASFVEGEWDGLLAGLESGRYDMMANGVDITQARQEKYDFSIPYAYNRTAVIVRTEDNSIHALEDLKGKHTANTISSTYAQLAEQYGAEVTAVDDLNQTMELLLAGRIDATLNSEVTFYDYLRAQPDAPVKVAVLTSEATQVAIPLRKGAESAALLNAINETVDELREDGTLTELSEKYFGSDITGE